MGTQSAGRDLFSGSLVRAIVFVFGIVLIAAGIIPMVTTIPTLFTMRDESAFWKNCEEVPAVCTSVRTETTSIDDDEIITTVGDITYTVDGEELTAYGVQLEKGVGEGDSITAYVSRKDRTDVRGKKMNVGATRVMTIIPLFIGFIPLLLGVFMVYGARKGEYIPPEEANQ